MAKFSLGEIAIFVDGPNVGRFDHKYIGQEVEIVSIGYISPHSGLFFDYGAKAPNGNIGGVNEILLRKKRPPEQVSTWTEVHRLTGWQPMKEEA